MFLKLKIHEHVQTKTNPSILYWDQLYVNVWIIILHWKKPIATLEIWHHCVTQSDGPMDVSPINYGYEVMLGIYSSNFNDKKNTHVWCLSSVEPGDLEA